MKIQFDLEQETMELIARIKKTVDLESLDEALELAVHGYNSFLAMTDMPTKTKVMKMLLEAREIEPAGRLERILNE